MASTLKAWQHAKSVTIMLGRVSHRATSWLVESLMQVFETGDAHAYSDDIAYVASRLDNKRNLDFTPQQGVQMIKTESECLFLIEDGVSLIVKSVTSHRGEHVEFTFEFEKPGQHEKFMKKVSDLWNSEAFLQYTVVGEDVIWIKGADGADPVFARDGKGLLGKRLLVSYEFGHTLFAIKPLEGEQLVVYGSRGSTTDLGLGQVAGKLKHPIGDVFVSVGPYSLQLVHDTSHNFRQPKRDTVGVYKDDKLPIKPFEQDSDDSGWDDDVDDEPREPHEF